MQDTNLAVASDINVALETKPPRIGEHWTGQGGIYAGVMRGRDGGPDYHLIVGPALGTLTFKAATAAASEVEADGHKDFTLPFRKEQSLQFANVPELFERDWYWSSELHASNSDYAWMQSFYYGYQNYDATGYGCRARAVRRLVIQ